MVDLQTIAAVQVEFFDEDQPKLVVMAMALILGYVLQKVAEIRSKNVQR